MPDASAAPAPATEQPAAGAADNAADPSAGNQEPPSNASLGSGSSGAGQQDGSQQQDVAAQNGTVAASAQAAASADGGASASVAAPSASFAEPATSAQATPVPLARAPEVVEQTIQLAVSRGVTQARVALQPAELGSIEIHLRATADGIVARVVASGADAAHVLQAAAGELRRSLEQQGVSLLRLDIGQSGDDAGGAGRGADRGEGSGGRADEQGGDGEAAESEDSDTLTLQLPSGVLIDVLA